MNMYIYYTGLLDIKDDYNNEISLADIVIAVDELELLEVF
jgi:hypothetical protein